MNKKLLVFMCVGLLLGVVVYGARRNTSSQKSVNTFEECAALGGPIMESYPRQCAADGKTFTENIGNELELTDFIRIESPRPQTTITSPLVVKGEARGTWYFEADFPVVLYDSEGNQLAIVPAQAQGVWMTEDFVPFSAELTFEVPEGVQSGELVFQKSNPSGLPENDAEVRVPVTFAQ